MRSFTRVILLIFSLLSIKYQSFAQPSGLPRSYSPPSPTAANLGLYAVAPVDHYTGVPALAIPIYDINVKNINLNISLSYHSAGVRQADEASWVGLGWSLNAGGVITRTKRDGDDFSEHGFYKNPAPSCSGAYDQEPDIFYFNFCGRTGKFVIENNNGNIANVRLISREMLKVRLTATTGWEVTDENGTIYAFETKENAREVVTYADNSTSTENYTSSWYLTKITNQFGESIDFAYNNTGAKSYKLSTQSATRSFYSASRWELFSTNYMIGIYNGAQFFQANNVSSSYTCKTESIVDEVLLSRIVFPVGSIDFTTTQRTDLNTHFSGMMYGNALEDIIIRKGKSITDPVLKKITLSYGAFNSLSGQSAKVASRLKLVAFTEKSGSLSLPPYQFIYNTNVLPDKGNTNRLGGFIENVTDGLIEKIIYPTGGYTQFTFEPHFANAGARVKKMVQKDPQGNYNVRNYEYNGEKKLGESLNFGSSLDVINFTAVQNGTGTQINGSMTFITRFYSDNCMMGESSSDYLVGYDQVVELFGDNGIYGKNIYTFKNDANTTVAYGVPAEVSNANGYLISKEEQKNENGVFVVTTKLVRDIQLQNVVSVQTRRRAQNSCNNTYSIKCDWMKLNWEEEYTYNKSGENPVVVRRSYFYDNANHIMPTRVVETDSKNSTWTKTRKYVMEAAAEGPAGNAYTLMHQRNIVAPLIEESLSKGTTFIAKNRTNYQDWYVNQTVIAPYSEEYQKGSFPVETRIRYKVYDRRGNLSEVSRDADMSTSYIWGYEYCFPIAEIKNGAFGDVKYSNFETNGYQGEWNYHAGYITSDITSPMGPRCYILNATYPLINPAAGSPGAYILSYWIKDGTTVTLSNSGTNVQTGRTINGWTYVQRELKDGNLVSMTGSGLIDEVRLYPKGAQVDTYTFEPVVGMKKHCDVNNNLTSYEYDLFGRLRFVKDIDGNIVKTYEYKYQQ